MIALGDPDNDFKVMTKVDICKLVGIGRRTLYDWLALEEFVEYVNHVADRSMESRIGDYYRALDSLIFNNPRGPSIKALEVVMRVAGKMKTDSKVELNVNDNKSLTDKSNEEVRDEISRLRGELGLDGDK